MKIAVPTRENHVDDHFGHCDHYTIYTIENDSIQGEQTLPSPQGCGCKSNIASILEQMGVTLMLAGNMGEGAKNVLESHHIEVVRGCSGNTKELVLQYLHGEIFDSGVGCISHNQPHVCQHGN